MSGETGAAEASDLDALHHTLEHDGHRVNRYGEFFLTEGAKAVPSSEEVCPAAIPLHTGVACRGRVVLVALLHSF